MMNWLLMLALASEESKRSQAIALWLLIDPLLAEVGTMHRQAIERAMLEAYSLGVTSGQREARNTSWRATQLARPSTI
jgi:hypothetical protein